MALWASPSSSSFMPAKKRSAHGARSATRQTRGASAAAAAAATSGPEAAGADALAAIRAAVEDTLEAEEGGTGSSGDADSSAHLTGVSESDSDSYESVASSEHDPSGGQHKSLYSS